MSEQTIYARLIAAGMSPAGAAGLMGNMQCESAMRASNAQDGMTSLSDEDYTTAVDNGTYSNFVRDAVGYGLCQWTYCTRKAALLAFAQSHGTSIGDESMQVQFAVQELKSDHAALWAYLCGTADVCTAASRVCTEYERPAVNNISARAEAAWEYYRSYAGTEPVTEPGLDTSAVTARHRADMSVLCMGFDGTQVDILRALLTQRGYDVSPGGVWEESFDAVFRQYQTDAGLASDGCCGAKTWARLMKG